MAGGGQQSLLILRISEDRITRNLLCFQNIGGNIFMPALSLSSLALSPFLPA